jgi:hypothetical protein
MYARGSPISKGGSLCSGGPGDVQRYISREDVRAGAAGRAFTKWGSACTGGRELGPVKEQNNQLHERLDDLTALVSAQISPRESYAEVAGTPPTSQPSNTQTLTSLNSPLRDSQPSFIAQSTPHGWKKQATSSHPLQSEQWWNPESAPNKRTLHGAVGP